MKKYLLSKAIIRLGISLLTLVFGMAVIGCNEEIINDDGFFILTNIPSEYNGKYAHITGYNQDITIIGAENINLEKETITMTRISHGTVRIPIWNIICGANSVNFEKYLVNDDLFVNFAIFNIPALELYVENNQLKIIWNYDYALETLRLDSVVFKNGNSKLNWNNVR